MGSSASLIQQGTPDQQSAVNEAYEKLKAEGLSEEDIEAQLKLQFEGWLAKKPKKIIISGAPASGKGTQCEWIREEFKCVHLSTGDILRAAVAAGTELGIEAKTYMDEGKLVPDETMIGLILARLQEADCVAQGWLLDGFPRTGPQADGLAKAGIECDYFIHLDVPNEILVERVVGRRLDPVTGTIYHIKFKPAPDEETAARLEQRSDDTEEKVAVRLEAFNNNLNSVLEFFTSKMFKVDGNRDPAVVWEEIKAKLNES